jgi:hypothetical protein
MAAMFSATIVKSENQAISCSTLDGSCAAMHTSGRILFF